VAFKYCTHHVCRRGNKTGVEQGWAVAYEQTEAHRSAGTLIYHYETTAAQPPDTKHLPQHCTAN